MGNLKNKLKNNKLMSVQTTKMIKKIKRIRKSKNQKIERTKYKLKRLYICIFFLQ